MDLVNYATKTGTKISAKYKKRESKFFLLTIEEAFDDLDAPIIRVTQADVPMPYAKNLEILAKPSAKHVIEAVNKVLYR